MSQEVGNIFVSLGLNMDNFNAGISNINRQMKLVQSEFKASAAKLSDFGSASDLVKLKTDSLSQQITLQKQKIDLLQSSIDNAVQKSSKHGQALHDIRTKLEAVRSEYNDVSSSMGKTSEQAQKLADTIAKLEAQEKAKIQTLQSDDKAIDNNRIKLNQYTEQLAKMETQLRTASEGLDGSSGKMKDLGESSSSLGSRLASLGAIVKSSLVFSAVYEGIGALTGGIKGLISTSMDFEATMSKVQALSGATGQQLQELRNQAIQLGSSTVFSASDAANGMADLAAAGFTAQQTMAAMPGILNAAAAAGEDFDSVSQIMISTMSAFGMKASDMGHIADVMAAAANASTISIGDMGQTLQYAAPLAKSAGVSLEALSADIAIMGNAGIKGSDAGTALREALTRLATPPAAAAKALQSLGIATKDSQGKMVPFNTILEEMHDKFQHLGQAQQLQAASAIFGQNAMSGMMTIVAASPAKIDALTRAFENSNGAAAKMASQMNNNLKGAVQQMEGAFESASIKIGGVLSPVLTKTANGIASVVGVISASNPGQAFVNLFPKSMQIGVEYFFDQMKGSIQDIKDAFGSTLGAKVSAFFASFKGAGTVAAKALEDVGGAIHAVVGLITGHEGQFTGFMQAMNIPPSITQAFENVMSLIKEAYSNVAPQFKAAFAQIVTFFKTNWPEISLAIRNVMSVILSIFNAVWPLIKVIVVSTLKTLVAMIRESINIILDVIKLFADLFTGNWKGLWSDIVDLLKNALGLAWNLFSFFIGGKILALFKLLKPLFGDLFGGAMSRLTSLASSGLGAIRNGFKTAFDWIYSNTIGRISSMVSSVGSKLSGLLSSVRGILGNIRALFSSTFTNTKQAIENAIESAVQSVKSKFEGLLSWFSGLPGRMASYGRQIINGLVTGFRNIHIPLPHFDFGEGHKKIAGVNVPYPTLNVDWYKTGGVFDGPSIIGVGEAGTEAVVPLSGKQMIPFAQAIAQALGTVTGAGMGGVSVTMPVYLDSKMIGKQVAVYSAQDLEKQRKAKARAQGRPN